MPRNNRQVRPEDNYNTRLTVTQGVPAPDSYVFIPNYNRIVGNCPEPSVAVLAQNVYAQPPMKWNKGGRRQGFVTPDIVKDLNNLVLPQIPFTPIRTFYAVPTPRIGLSAVTSASQVSK